MTNEVDELKASVGELNTKVVNLDTKVVNLDTKVVNLETKVDTHIKVTKDALDSMGAQIEKIHQYVVNELS